MFRWFSSLPNDLDRPNPFQHDGELHRKADYILAHSIISRSELRIADPDVTTFEWIARTDTKSTSSAYVSQTVEHKVNNNDRTTVYLEQMEKPSQKNIPLRNESTEGSCRYPVSGDPAEAEIHLRIIQSLASRLIASYLDKTRVNAETNFEPWSSDSLFATRRDMLASDIRVGMEMYEFENSPRLQRASLYRRGGWENDTRNINDEMNNDSISMNKYEENNSKCKENNNCNAIPTPRSTSSYSPGPRVNDIMNSNGDTRDIVRNSVATPKGGLEAASDKRTQYANTSGNNSLFCPHSVGRQLSDNKLSSPTPNLNIHSNSSSYSITIQQDSKLGVQSPKLTTPSTYHGYQFHSFNGVGSRSATPLSTAAFESMTMTIPTEFESVSVITINSTHGVAHTSVTSHCSAANAGAQQSPRSVADKDYCGVLVYNEESTKIDDTDVHELNQSYFKKICQRCVVQ